MAAQAEDRRDDRLSSADYSDYQLRKDRREAVFYFRLSLTLELFDRREYSAPCLPGHSAAGDVWVRLAK